METPSVRIDAIDATAWQLLLGASGGVVEGENDVAQCIRIILTTPCGSVPHRPDFGSNLWLYLGRPIDAARPHVIRETVDAITRWESRVEVLRVTLQLAASAEGWLVEIEYRILLGVGSRSVTRVEIPA